MAECEHVWHEDADDEGRTFRACVRVGGCGARAVTGTVATRW